MAHLRVCWLVVENVSRTERRMNWSSLPSSMSSHNKIHKPRPAGSERTTGFCQKKWLFYNYGCADFMRVLRLRIRVCESVSVLSYWLIGMVGRKKNAQGHFRAMNKPDPEPIYIYWYIRFETHKKGKIWSLAFASASSQGVRKTNGLVTPHPLSRRCILRCPIVSTSFIFPSYFLFPVAWINQY